MTPHYYVSQEEIQEHPSYRYLDHGTAPSLVERSINSKEEFFCNTLGWDTMHIASFRALLFKDLPLDRICPSSYIISTTSTLAERVKETFGVPSNEAKTGQYNITSITA